MRAKKKAQPLTESEIDQIVVAQADDDTAWGKPVRVRKTKPASVPLPSALAAWDRGYCPACGSWPALAERIGAAEHLRCSYCGAEWQLQSRRCVYCHEAGEAFRTITPRVESPHEMLDLCDQCGSYTKATLVAEATPSPLLAIEDLATVELDRTAAHRGYGRPPLLELGEETTDRPPCEP